MIKIIKLLGYKTQWRTNATALHQVSSSLTALKIIIIYVYGCEKKKRPKQVYTDMCKIKSGKLIVINLDR